ncbi:MAG: chloride channel protein [Desulfobacteraceae bacterium]|jgi:CIC family chloride channel protein
MDPDAKHHRIGRQHLISSEHTIMSALAVVVGLAGGMGAVGFRYLINFVQVLAYGSEADLIEILPSMAWSIKVWVPAAGGLIVGPLVYFWAREAKGHGVPEVMEAVALKGGIIRKRIVVIKSLASAICIGTGGAVGREGPIVQIGSAIGSIIGQIIKISADRMRTLVGCGAAAGIAATFNAPIAGSMFALELILADFGLATFSPIVISAVVATAVSRHYLGDFPAFIVPAYELVSAWYTLLSLTFLKILASAVTIGSGGSGGIFAPSLFIGAMAGGFFGMTVHSFWPGITASPGAYGIVGMGAVVAATTHGPLTAILMLFEMTGDYKIILPLMITCIISALAAGQLYRESIYTLKLTRRGVDIRAGREVNVLKSIPVQDVMNTQVETIYEGTPLGGFSQTIARSKYNSFPVLDADNRLVGIISFADYRDAVFNEDLKDLVVAKDLATTDVRTIAMEANLFEALEAISYKDFAILPVVAADDDRRLMGVVSRRDILGAYDKAVLKKFLFSRP